MTEPKKKPGRPALPPGERKALNLTFRSRGGMRERLAEAAAAKERSISEEIENRLEQSFEIEKRFADFQERWKKIISDHQAEAREAKEEAQKFRNETVAVAEEAKRELLQANEESEKRYAEVERQLERATAALQVVEALIGENKASTDLIRKVAAELMSHPEWDRTKAERKLIADRIHSYILPEGNP